MRVEVLFLQRVYPQEVTKKKETIICCVCPENRRPGAKSVVEQVGLVLGGRSYAVWPMLLVLHPSPPASLCKDVP